MEEERGAGGPERYTGSANPGRAPMGLLVLPQSGRTYTFVQMN